MTIPNCTTTFAECLRKLKSALTDRNAIGEMY